MLLSPAPMHIPDGFLSVVLAVILWLISIAVVAYALKRVGKDLNERMVPMMGVLAAAIFAGQMLNFAVAGGTSGHLMGAAIATILVGPWAAILVMTSVVSIQALIFQDGGLLVLGANIFNMAIVGVAVAYFAYRTLRRLADDSRWGIFVAGFLAAWSSVVIASLCVALQLSISGTTPANLAIPAMLGVHLLIGIGEGLITIGALAFLYSTRPDLLQPRETATRGNTVIWIAGLLLALALAILAPLASAHPDGLEWVAEQQGFLDIAQDPTYQLIPDYLLPGVSNEALATILAGLLGALLVFGVVIAVAMLRRNRQVVKN
jgi:cobalt/nickel transport system permease protein